MNDSEGMWRAQAGGFSGGSDCKESTCNAGDPNSIPGLGKSPGEGNGKPLQYSSLENSMDRAAWWTTVHFSKELDMAEQLTFTHSLRLGQVISVLLSNLHFTSISKIICSLSVWLTSFCILKKNYFYFKSQHKNQNKYFSLFCFDVIV